MYTGAWVGHRLQGTPQVAAEKAVRAGLSDVSIILNDASNQYSGPAIWKPYDLDNVKESFKAFSDAGVCPHFMVWAVSDTNYFDDMAVTLRSLIDEGYVPATIQLDAEESWIRRNKIQAKTGPYALDKLKTLGVPITVTAIAHTDFEAVSTLIEDGMTVIPQAYCTKTAWDKYKVNPNTTPEKACARFLKNIPRQGMALECALAAYDLDGAAELSTNGSILASLESARRGGSSKVWYWYLDAMTPGVCDSIKSLSEHA